MKVKLKPSKYLDSCDFCESQEGSHYCLLYGCTVRNMNIVKCDDWTVQKRYTGDFMQQKVTNDREH